MPGIKVVRTIDAGHRIVGHEGKCARLHGHTYRFEIEMFSSLIQEPGFVMDFGLVKKVVDIWDHRLLLWTQDPLLESVGYEPLLRENGVLVVPFNPTAEHMASFLCDRLLVMLGQGGVEVTVWETPNNAAYAKKTSRE